MVSRDPCAPGPVIVTRGATTYTFDVGATLGEVTQDLDPNMNIPYKFRGKLYDGYIAYSWANGWLLLTKSKHGGDIFCCFNPHLRWPENCIHLPHAWNTRAMVDKGPNAPPIMAGFSSLPPDSGSWTLLVVGGGRTVSTIGRGALAWRNYNFATAREEGRVCVGIGCPPGFGEFYCLFDKGDILVFSTDDDLEGPRKMITAAPPRQLLIHNSCKIIDVHVPKPDGKVLVVRWRRDEIEKPGGGRQYSFRLMRVGIKKWPASEQDIPDRFIRMGSISEDARTIKKNRKNENRELIVLGIFLFLVAVPCFLLFYFRGKIIHFLENDRLRKR